MDAKREAKRSPFLTPGHDEELTEFRELTQVWTKVTEAESEAGPGSESPAAAAGGAR